MARHSASSAGLAAAGLAGLSFINGFYEPTFGSRVPAVQSALGLETSALAGPLLAYPCGLAVGGLLATLALARVGTRACLLVGGFLNWVPLLAIGALLAGLLPVPGFTGLVVLWGIAGLGNGILDPAHAVLAARLPGKRMRNQSLLAVKMFGTVLAAVAGMWAIGSGFGVSAHFALAGTFALIVGLASAAIVPRAAPERRADAQGAPVGIRGLLALGLIAAASVIPVGAAINWATKFYVLLEAPEWLVGLGLVTFACAQMIGFLVAWHFSERIAPTRLASAGTVTATLGVAIFMLVVTDVEWSWLPTQTAIVLATVAFGLVGAGVAPIAPIVHRAAMNVRARRLSPSTQVGVVVTIQYVCQGLAPVAIARASGLIGVPAAFVAVCVVCLIGLRAGLGRLRHAGDASHPRSARPTGRHRRARRGH